MLDQYLTLVDEWYFKENERIDALDYSFKITSLNPYMYANAV